MILVYADCSKDHPIMSVGYLVFRSENGEERLLNTGTRVLNVEADERDISWTTERGEYFAAVVGVRAALEYTHEEIVVHLDNAGVVKAIKQRSWDHERYFPHALFSFLERFEDYHVRIVHRKQNEKAHEQARVGLRAGRELREGVV